MQSMLSAPGMAAANRAELIRQLIMRGAMSRAELARTVGVPRASVGSMVSSLLGTVLEEGDPAPSHGSSGKPGRPVALTATAGLTCAIAVAPSEVTLALVNARGDIAETETHRMPRRPRTPELDEFLFELIEAKVRGRLSELVAAALLVPAQCNPVRVFRSVELPALKDTNAHNLVAHRLGLRCHLDQLIRATALGEGWYGNRPHGDFAAVQLDLGVAAGVMVDRKLNHGRHYPTAQLGHVCVDRTGPRCRCGLRGCWETVAGLRWLRKQVAERGLPRPRSATVSTLTELAAEDTRAADLLAEYADNVGLGLAALYQILGTPLFILHGAGLAGADAFAAQVERALLRQVLVGESSPRVTTTALGPDAALHGGCVIAMNRVFGLSV